MFARNLYRNILSFISNVNKIFVACGRKLRVGYLVFLG